MDGFGDNFVPNGESNGAVAVDPAADFLAREQSELAGIEDPPTLIEEAAAPASEEPPADLAPAEELISEAAAPVSEEPPVDLAPAEELMSDGAVEVPTVTIVPAPQRTPERVVTPVPRIDPEAIREWRAEHQRKLVEKDEAEEHAKDNLREKAKTELEDWYKQHDEQVAKTRQANRCAEKELVADTERPEPGTEWERISKLCDFNPKTAKSSRDVSRMRSIILHVKQAPPVKA